MRTNSALISAASCNYFRIFFISFSQKHYTEPVSTAGVFSGAAHKSRKKGKNHSGCVQLYHKYFSSMPVTSHSIEVNFLFKTQE